MINQISSCSNFLSPSIEGRETCVTVTVTVVATLAIGAMVISLLSILGTTGPMAGLNSGATFGVLSGGGVVVSTILVSTAMASLRTKKREVVEEEEPVKEATIDEWRTEFPKRALRRLGEKTPVAEGHPPSLTTEEIILLGDKMTWITARPETAQKNGVRLHDAGDHIVFEIDEIDGVIFKFSDSEEAQTYVDLRNKARRICFEKQLYLIQIPPCDFVELSDERQVIIERKIPNLQGSYAFQEELYQWGWSQPQLQPYFYELFSQLLKFICLTDFGDCKYNNIPLSIDGNLGLIDLDDWGAAEGLVRSFAGGQFHKGYENHGLFNYLPSVLLDKFVGQANALLGKGWLRDFLSEKLGLEDQWLDLLAREALGADLGNKERLSAAVRYVQENPEVFEALVKNLPETDGLFSCMATALGCSAFMKAQVQEKVVEIKNDPIKVLSELDLTVESSLLPMFGTHLLVAQKIAEIRGNPQVLIEMIRARIEEREKRSAAFEIFRPQPLGAFEEVSSVIEGLKDPKLDSERIYATAGVIMEYAAMVAEETQTTCFSARRSVELHFSQMWAEGAKRMSMYENRQKSIVPRQRTSFRTNVEAALELLVELGCIFRYEYEKPNAGVNGSGYVTVEF